MKIPESFAVISALFMMAGCAGNGPTPPADVWGSVGFSYEAEKGTMSHESGRSAAVIGFEKELSPRLSLGFEAGGNNAISLSKRPGSDY
jgi:predicted small lipoprotein YifL